MNSLSLSNLIALGEGFTTEFKRSMPSDLGREICQMSPDWVTVTFPRHEATSAPHVTPHVAPHVTPHVGRLIAALERDMSRAEFMNALTLADRRHFARTYLQPGVEAGLVEMTLPDRPRSREQRYRLTILGEQVRDSQPEAGGNA